MFVFGMDRGTLTRVTSGGEPGSARWGPDAERLAFGWLKDGVYGIALQQLGASEAPTVVARVAGRPSSWSPDGSHLAIAAYSDGSATNADIWIATLEGSKANLDRLTQTPHPEMWPELSPDGEWLAYGSRDSGRWEVYVQPYPGTGPRTQVSVSGGRTPVWNPSGGEIFFVTGEDRGPSRVDRMMVVSVQTSPSLRIGAPRELFAFSNQDLSFNCVPVNCYSVSPDGQRFFVTEKTERTAPPPVTHINLIQNWLEEVKARVPTE